MPLNLQRVQKKGKNMCPECGSKMIKHYDKKKDVFIFYCSNTNCGYLYTVKEDE